MNINTAAAKLAKINLYFGECQKNPGSINKMELHLLLDNIRAFYEALLEEAEPSAPPVVVSNPEPISKPSKANLKPGPRVIITPDVPFAEQSSQEGDNQNTKDPETTIEYPPAFGTKIQLEQSKEKSTNEAPSDRIEPPTVPAESLKPETTPPPTQNEDEDGEFEEELEHGFHIQPPKEIADVVTPISELKSSIAINDRLLFIGTLFNGDQSAFSVHLEAFNKMSALEEAKKYAKKNLWSQYKWMEASKKDALKSFVKLLYRRYLPPKQNS